MVFRYPNLSRTSLNFSTVGTLTTSLYVGRVIDNPPRKSAFSAQVCSKVGLNNQSVYLAGHQLQFSWINCWL